MLNPHYHPYPDLSSPHHSPPPHNMGVGGNYVGGNHQTNGHNNMNMISNHHQHFINSASNSGNQPSPGMHPLHQHSSENVNHSNNNNNNNNNNNSSQNIKMCAGCGNKIMERFLLHALERFWHNHCLKCACCGAMLAEIGQSCYFKSNMILCKQDYLRLFGQQHAACSACGITISASEYVMRAGGPSGGPPGTQHHPHTINVFHVKCFTCNKCGIQLMPGDRYYLLNGNLVCEQDWHKILKGNLTGPGSQNATTGTTNVRKGKVGRPRRSRD